MPHSKVINNSKVINSGTILCLALLSLTGCDTLFGAKGKSVYPSRTAAIEARRDEELFTTSYEIHFDSNSVTPDKEGATAITSVADMIKRSQPTLVKVTGYSDSYGDASYNKRLSKKRAQAVVKALASQGVDARLIKVAALGEEKPSIPTQDGVKILENRRVLIELKK